MPPTTPPSSPFLLRALRLTGLCSLAVLQPALDAVARNDAYRHEAQIGAAELLVLIALLAFVVPAIVIACDWLIGRIARGVHGVGRNLVFFVLTTTAVLVQLRGVLNLESLQQDFLVWIAALALAVPLGGLIAFGHERWTLLGQWVSFTVLGSLLFPLAFAARLHSQSVAESKADRPTVVARPVPIVIVVFDEFCGLTLMDESLELDAVRYPNFARLAASSTWYRNATSVHARTFMATPAILSGRNPTPERSPDAKNYPRNLFERLHDSGAYDLAVFEPLTRLCNSSDVRNRVSTPLLKRTLGLIQVVSAVYPQLVLPQDAPVSFPVVPDIWYGIVEDINVPQGQNTGRMVYNWNIHRARQLDHFLQCLAPNSRPRFCFLHAGLPHYPWVYLPTGETYLDSQDAPGNPPHGLGTLGEDWIDDAAAVARDEFRYRQQLGFVDRFIGRLQDRLHELDVWDDCLLIVTADHGVSFRAGHSRRVPDNENLPDLVSVPLFVKLPGQSTGSVSDTNVETIDLLPTLADVIGMTPNDDWDGQSLLSSDERARKSFYCDQRLIVIEPDFPQKRAAVARQQRLFRDAPVDRPPAMTCARPEWLGRTIAEFPVRDALSSTLDLGVPSIRTEPFVPCLVDGSLESREVGAEEDMILAVDGVVCDVCRLVPSGWGLHGFTLWAPREIAIHRDRRWELFLAPHGKDAEWKRVHAWTPQ